MPKPALKRAQPPAKRSAARLADKRTLAKPAAPKGAAPKRPAAKSSKVGLTKLSKYAAKGVAKRPSMLKAGAVKGKASPATAGRGGKGVAAKAGTVPSKAIPSKSVPPKPGPAQAPVAKPVSAKAMTAPAASPAATARPAAKSPVPPAKPATAAPSRAASAVTAAVPPPLPVKAKKNVAGLSARDLQRFADLLLVKRREIVGDMHSMEGEALRSGPTGLSSLPVHMADMGTDNYEQEFTLGLVEKDRHLLREINHALAKIPAGTYGICEGTGAAIGKPRLEVQPWARFSIEYARQKERNGRGVRVFF